MYTAGEHGLSQLDSLAAAFCPAALPSFRASVKQTSSVCAIATETYYFTPLPKFVGVNGFVDEIGSGGPSYGPDLPSFPLFYDTPNNNAGGRHGYRAVFKDPNGVTPMDDGWYASGTGPAPHRAIQVENGIVIANIACT